MMARMEAYLADQVRWWVRFSRASGMGLGKEQIRVLWNARRVAQAMRKMEVGNG